MTALTTIDVKTSERAFVVKNGVPTRYLRAGRMRVWSLGARVEVRRVALADRVAVLSPEEQALVPDADLQRVSLSATQRAFVLAKGKAVLLLGAGEHLVWRYEDVAVEVLDVAGVACAPLRDERRALMLGKGYVETTVPAGCVGLRFVDGVVDAELPPGKHAAFSVEHDVAVVSVDLRERIAAITGQEVMTKDKVSLRLNASIAYRVGDAARVAAVSKDAEAQLYLAGQLALRDAVAGHVLDELLSNRTLLADGVRATLVDKAARLGLVLVEVGVKDLVLPGEMRTLLNRVIEAQKDAEANVITRREETAAARSLAQTAKVLAENPVLLRLKELESYRELAAKVGTLNVVMGDAGLAKLELKV